MTIIKMGVKGLAKFMTASAAGQRKVLRDYKYPEEEGTAQAAYYREARDLVADYHRNGRAAAWLQEKAAILASTAAALGGRAGTRLKHNARALSEYAANFPRKTFEVLPEQKFYISYGNVRISIVPDLHARDNQRERFIKIEFASKQPDAQTIKIVSQLMFEAAIAARLPVRSSDVLYVDVSRGQSHKGARIGAKMSREIEAACANISAMWDSI